MLINEDSTGPVRLISVDRVGPLLSRGGAVASLAAAAGGVSESNPQWVAIDGIHNQVIEVKAVRWGRWGGLTPGYLVLARAITAKAGSCIELLPGPPT